MKMKSKSAWKYPHIRAIICTIFVMLVSGVASIALFNCYGAISAILASICAGCVTGIVFYVITNARNNEIWAIREEYEEAQRHYKEASRIMRLCFNVIENTSNEEAIEEICKSTKKLDTYMATICFDASRTTQIIKDFPPDYNEKAESASKAIVLLEESEKNDLDEKQIQKALAEVMLYCSTTKDILLEPWIELMRETAHLEKAVL